MGEQADYIKMAILSPSPENDDAKVFAMIAQAIELRRIADSLDNLSSCVREYGWFCVETRRG